MMKLQNGETDKKVLTEKQAANRRVWARDAASKAGWI
jgi:hypothetical protein